MVSDPAPSEAQSHAPVVIPTKAPLEEPPELISPPPEPEQPCEPQTEREPIRKRGTRKRTRGVHWPITTDPLDLD